MTLVRKVASVTALVLIVILAPMMLRMLMWVVGIIDLDTRRTVLSDTIEVLFGVALLVFAGWVVARVWRQPLREWIQFIAITFIVPIVFRAVDVWRGVETWSWPALLYMSIYSAGMLVGVWLVHRRR